MLSVLEFICVLFTWIAAASQRRPHTETKHAYNHEDWMLKKEKCCNYFNTVADFMLILGVNLLVPSRYQGQNNRANPPCISKNPLRHESGIA